MWVVFLYKVQSGHERCTEEMWWLDQEVCEARAVWPNVIVVRTKRSEIRMPCSKAVQHQPDLSALLLLYWHAFEMS